MWSCERRNKKSKEFYSSSKILIVNKAMLFYCLKCKKIYRK